MEIDEKDYQILKAKADNYDKDMNELKTEYDEKIKSLSEERDSYKTKYDDEVNAHAKLKDDYISFLTGHSNPGKNPSIETDNSFDELCKTKFGG